MKLMRRDFSLLFFFPPRKKSLFGNYESICRCVLSYFFKKEVLLLWKLKEKMSTLFTEHITIKNVIFHLSFSCLSLCTVTRQGRDLNISSAIKKVSKLHKKRRSTAHINEATARLQEYQEPSSIFFIRFTNINNTPDTKRKKNQSIANTITRRLCTKP